MTTPTPQVQVPASWPGSMPEYIAYQTFISLGKEPGEDFVYQSPLAGGRLDKGGIVLDFVFYNYHYEFGVEVRARDLLARAMMAGDGVALIFIDDDDLIRDPEYYCREALNYQDHSQLGGG